MFKTKKCEKCGGKIKDKFDFCPYCGLNLANPEQDIRDFGMLGKNDRIEGYPLVGGVGGMGISERLIDSLFKNLIKNLEKQMQNSQVEGPEIQNFKNGIKISLGGLLQKKKTPKQTPTRRIITEEQIKRMGGLPRVEAKSDVRRFSDKIVYDLKAVGIGHVNDVFISRLESGYEIKAIGKKKIYVNSIPVNLPLKGYSITEKGLKVEFGLG